MGKNYLFLFLLKNIDCGYSLEPPHLTSTHNLCVEQNYEKYQNFLSEKISFSLVVKFSIYLNRCVFVMYFDIVYLTNINIIYRQT